MKYKIESIKYSELDGLTLGIFLEKLLKITDPSKNVYFDFPGIVPTRFDSWRGRYEEIALGYKLSGNINVSDLIDETESAIGSTFEGYKGGYYKMTENTKIFVNNYGDYDEYIITDVVERNHRVIIITENVWNDYLE